MKISEFLSLYDLKSSFVQFDWSLFDIICLFIPNSTVPLLASFPLPFLLSPLSLSSHSQVLSLSLSIYIYIYEYVVEVVAFVTALALLGVTGVGRCCKRLVGVGESAPAFVFFNIIFIWGVYIGLVRQGPSFFSVICLSLVSNLYPLYDSLFDYFTNFKVWVLHTMGFEWWVFSTVGDGLFIHHIHGVFKGFLGVDATCSFYYFEFDCRVIIFMLDG